MHGAIKPAVTTLKPGDTLVRQGQVGSDLYLVLDGVIRVDRDSAQLAEYGRGAILGARAHLGTGARTSTLIAVTPRGVAAVPVGRFGAEALIELKKRAAGLRDGPVPVALAADGEVICL